MTLIGSFTHQNNSLLRQEGLSLLLEFSHICVAIPLQLAELSEDKRKALFILTTPSHEIPLEEWNHVLTFSSPYKIQALPRDQEKDPFLCEVDLIDKKILEKKFFLYFEIQSSPSNKNFSLCL